METLVEHLIGAERHALGASAARVAIVLAAVSRALATVLVGVLAASDGPALVWALALAGLASVALSVPWQWRDAGRSRTAVLAPLGVEMALVGAAAALSGASESPVLLVVLVVLIGGALLLRPAEIAVLGAAAVGGMALLGVRDAALAVWAVEIGWATAVGAAFAAQRGALLARMTRLDRQREAVLLTLRRPARVERGRVGAALRETVLDPVSATLAGTATASTEALRVYAEDLRRAGASMRAVVADLHSPSGGPAGLEHALRRLGARRAPGARVIVEIVASPPEAVVERLVSIARDVLDLVVGPASREVRVAVDAGEDTVALEVEAHPPSDPPAPRLRAAARDRLGLLGAELLDVSRGAVRARVALAEGPLGVDPRFPGRDEPLAVRTLSVARLGAVLVVLANGAIVGGTEPGFWLAAGAMALAAPVMVYVLETRRFGLRRFGALIAADQLLYLAAFALAGDAQAAALPLLLAVPLCYALLLGPGPTAVGAALVVAGLTVVGDPPAGFWLTYAWATAVALLMAWGTALASRLLAGLAERRRALQGRMLAEEEAARRRLAGDLHDDALQLLLAARQDLAEAVDGVAGARERARRTLALAGTTLLRTLGELEEREGQAAATGGLRGALERAIAGPPGREGPEVVLAVDEAAGGQHDGLVVRLVRELVINARMHAEATAVRVDVRSQDGHLLVDVADDGVGWNRPRLEDAVERGHIGLASATERVLLAGGRLELHEVEGGGARILTVLPPAGQGAGG